MKDPLLPLMRTPRMPVVDWTDAPAPLSGLVRFAERRNIVFARVPSHFKHSLAGFSETTMSLVNCAPNVCLRAQLSSYTGLHHLLQHFRTLHFAVIVQMQVSYGSPQFTAVTSVANTITYFFVMLK